jgi:hypothetical protein
MAARVAASGFVPGGYLFLEAGDGAGQADFFHATAGDMAGFAIAVDVEPATGSEPTAADAHACVARLRQLYPSHPVIGYIPQWYWGNQSTRFVDVVSYVVTGLPAPHRPHRPGVCYGRTLSTPPVPRFASCLARSGAAR